VAFVFYDTETTGLDWAFDQILQFAAVRTDASLQPIDEAQFHSRLLPHVIPSPEAMRVNGMAPERLVNPALPSHYQMVCAINAKLRGWGSSMYMGFNSFGLDENMLRAAFYKTFTGPI
jgi:exodeoxyribonuclease-1